MLLSSPPSCFHCRLTPPRCVLKSTMRFRFVGEHFVEAIVDRHRTTTRRRAVASSCPALTLSVWPPDSGVFFGAVFFGSKLFHFSKSPIKAPSCPCFRVRTSHSEVRSPNFGPHTECGTVIGQFVAGWSPAWCHQLRHCTGGPIGDPVTVTGILPVEFPPGESIGGQMASQIGGCPPDWRAICFRDIMHVPTTTTLITRKTLRARASAN